MNPQTFSEPVPVTTRAKKNPARKMRTELFVKDIDAQVKSNFKAACARKRRSMSAVVVQFMRDFAKGHITLQ